MRVTSKQLEEYVRMLNKCLCLPSWIAYSLSTGPNGYRLECNKGSTDVSERISASEMRQYLLGMLEVYNRYMPEWH
jgi:hypothetical protein